MNCFCDRTDNNGINDAEHNSFDDNQYSDMQHD
jgi:hypothetical protein